MPMAETAPPTQQPLPFDRQAQRGVRERILRYFFGSAAAISALAALLFWLLATYIPPLPRLAVGAWFGGISVASLAALRLRPALLQRSMLGVALAAVAGIGLATAAAGTGIDSPSISFLGLITCMVCASSTRRIGTVVALACGALLCGLALGEWRGALAGGGGQVVPLSMRLAMEVLAVVAGLVGGVLMERITLSHVGAAVEREQRFRSLLAIAADAYWETDEQLELRHAWRRSRSAGQFVPLELPDGHLAWALPTLQMESNALKQVREQMQARRAFREVPAQRQLPGGRLVHLLTSGEPRFAADGQFIGYWGLVRDVTQEVLAREALAETETRYRELFDQVPIALLVHREGRVQAANPAAARLLGFANPSAMVGADLLASFATDGNRDSALARLQARPDLLLPGMDPGDPQAAFTLQARTLGGRALLLNATGVPVDTPQGLATLSMLLDQTEQHIAEAATRRWQTLLERLVLASPDAITLTDLETGRYEMVNAAFLRLTGWDSTQQVVGHTSFELNIWQNADERQQLLGGLAKSEVVQDLRISFRSRHGDAVPVRLSATRFLMDGREYLVTNSREIDSSERARLEREAILDNASIGIALTRRQRFMLANRRFEQMLGWPPGALVGQHGRVAWPSDDEYAEVGRTVGPMLARGEQVEVERRLQRQDGSHFLARILAKAIDPTRPADSGTIWTMEDVTERRATEAALARARDQAEAANRAKSAFLANTSHEIRTPLNGLVGLAKLARAPELDETRRRQYLDQISESAQALSAIISDILDLSKIEAGKLELETVPFDLHELLQGLHRAYSALADARGLHCTLQTELGLPEHVRGDPLRVRQILSNFLSNALKFTPAGGIRIVAQAPDDQGFVRFEVHDSGPGIDPGVQARLFQPFSQADDSTTRRYGGTGLGLSICRELAQMMGGEVGADSLPGEGSCFWVRLPLPEADMQGADSGFAGLDANPLQGARVLMVEDNAVNMMIGVAMLEQWGAQVRQASDGGQAVEEVLRAARGERPFDIVLMDLQMPGMGGHEATRMLRRYFDRRALPIVALTAAALVSEREASMQAGMDGFVTKPIDEKRLHDTLVRVLAQRKLAELDPPT
ncbi:signal transduction histidine kinase [Burkholderiales bacterium JOSHI_001]|nr:signal transduction histidine kinase [Burkholderiales bacterium JOSHI_001]